RRNSLELRVFLLNFLGDCSRNRFIVVELHRVLRTALGHRTQVVDIFEHVGERHHGADHNCNAAGFLPLDLSTAAVQVADDVADVILRRNHLDLHDRLKQLDTELGRSLLEACARSDLERQHRGVDVMEGAIQQRGLDTDHREAGKGTGTHDTLETLLDTGDVFLRNRAADDLGLECEILALGIRLEQNLDTSELAGTAGLLLVRVVLLVAAGDGFTVSHLWRTDIGLNLELTLQAVDDNVEMKLAHSSDDGLTRLFISPDPEGRVLRGQAMKRHAHFLLVALGLRLDGDLNDGIRELHPLQNDRLGRIAKRISGGGFLQSRKRHDIAGKSLFDILARVGMHLEHAADALLLALD